MELAPFLEYLQQRAGDSLRAVEWYREDEAELIYLRDDLDVGEVQPRADEIHQRLIGGESLAEPQQLRELGPRLATINLHEEAVLINLPVGEQYGVVVGLEPEAARNLHDFVTDARTQLRD